MLQPFAQQAAIAVRGLRLKAAIGDAEERLPILGRCLAYDVPVHHVTAVHIWQERLALTFCTMAHVSEDIDGL